MLSKEDKAIKRWKDKICVKDKVTFKWKIAPGHTEICSGVVVVKLENYLGVKVNKGFIYDKKWGHNLDGVLKPSSSDGWWVGYGKIISIGSRGKTDIKKSMSNYI